MNDFDLLEDARDTRWEHDLLAPNEIRRRANRRTQVRRASGAAAAIVSIAIAYAVVGTPQPVVVVPATSPTGGLDETLNVDLSTADSAQKQAFQDNLVTQPEYRAGFDRYRACLSDEGYQLVSVRDTGLLFDFGVPSEAVDSGVDESCYTHHFKAVDMAWQLFHGDDISE